MARSGLKAHQRVTRRWQRMRELAAARVACANCTVYFLTETGETLCRNCASTGVDRADAATAEIDWEEPVDEERIQESLDEQEFREHERRVNASGLSREIERAIRMDRT